MTRVPFGSTASAFLRSATLQYHFKRLDPALKLTALQLAETFYVVDFVAGLNSSEEAFRLYQEVSLILTKAGMKLPKLSTNAEELSRHVADGMDTI
ncbi:hypothetical protein HPB50_026792 [Hyalomma asiaticum]|uniref:Uncharacterized protein n=1 Tax=Hyalomma asiaticum TaxID=266040 RepID=A0ACB7TPB2_HYAAI|nr:hypothetical protein HPB50_026792 [Hyalomma asiaticum]